MSEKMVSCDLARSEASRLESLRLSGNRDLYRIIGTSVMDACIGHSEHDCLGKADLELFYLERELLNFYVDVSSNSDPNLAVVLPFKRAA